MGWTCYICFYFIFLLLSIFSFLFISFLCLFFFCCFCLSTKYPLFYWSFHPYANWNMFHPYYFFLIFYNLILENNQLFFFPFIYISFFFFLSSRISSQLHSLLSANASVCYFFFFYFGEDSFYHLGKIIALYFIHIKALCECWSNYVHFKCMDCPWTEITNVFTDVVMKWSL